MCDLDSNERRVCSVGTGVRLCNFITLHANFNQGWPRRPSEYGRQREREIEETEMEDKCAGNGERERKGEGERWCDDGCRRCVCTCICRQINHEMASYSIKMLM